MDELIIEWRHYQKEGAICRRCSVTGANVRRVVEELQRELAPSGGRVVFAETALTGEQMPQSNLILINGIPLEKLLSGAKASETPCASCGCLTGKEEYCRSVELDGKTHEEIPEEMILMAVRQALRLKEP
jgi:hypothetical protein